MRIRLDLVTQSNPGSGIFKKDNPSTDSVDPCTTRSNNDFITSIITGHGHLSMKVGNIEFEFGIKFLTLSNLRYTMHQNFTSNTHLHTVIRPQIRL